MMAVEVAAHEDAQTGAGAAPGLLGDLQRHAVGRHDIVAADHAVGLDAEDLIEIYAPERHEGRGSLRRCPPKFGVEGGQELIAQIAVRGGHGGDAGHPQLVDEAVLQGAVDPLAAAPRLRRVAEDVLDAEPGEGAADLGGVAAIRRTPGRRGVHGPMGAVGIERRRNAVTLEDGAQGGHEGGHAFAAVMEFGVQQLLGGIVDAGEQGGPAVRRQGQPAMATAVEVEQLAVTRARLPAAAMPGAGPGGGGHARHLQGLLHEGIAEAHVMVATRELMEMADVEALVALAIEGEPALHFRHRRPLGRGRLPTAVEEALIPLVLQLPAQAPDAARTAPADVGGLQPGELAREGANDDLLDLHGALHNATWIGHGHLLGGYSFHAARLERSFHVSIPGGHFTYPQHLEQVTLTRRGVDAIRDRPLSPPAGGLLMTFKVVGVFVAGIVVLATTAVVVDAQGPIRIGASMSLHGTYAKLGKNQHEGYKLCERDLNAKGGLLGRKVEMVVYDDQSMPATAVRLYEKLITEDKVDGIMGPYSSPVTEAAANITEKYKKVMVSPVAATTSIFRKCRKYSFMVISPAEVYLEGLLDIAAKRGLKTVAVVHEDTLFSKAAASGAVELAKKKGMQVVFTEAYPKGNTDFSALLTKVKAANPDVIAAATYFDDAVALTRQMKELNVNPKMYGVTVGGELPEFYDTLKQNAEYIYGATQWEHTLPYAGNQEWFESYKKEFAHDPSYHSAAGYAGCLVYAQAAKPATSPAA